MTATSIIGDKVVNPQEEHLGSIEDIMMDVLKGRIEYVVIEFGGFLGIGEKFFAVPFSLLKLDTKNQQFVLHQNKETLKNAPGFDKGQWPETNSHQFDHSSTYWGSFMGANTQAVPH